MKVLGFDSWAQGAHHYQRLADAFRVAGMELLLVHLGSWGDDPGREKEERIGTLLVRDISYYRSASLAAVLDAERPAVVLFLSTRSFAHRAFLRLCTARGIPTINLYHGLVRVQAVDDVGPAYPQKNSAYLRFVLGRLPKFFRHTLRSYGGALLSTRASLSDWVRFVGDAVGLMSAKIPAVAAPDASPSVCCVYTPADIPHAMLSYGLPLEQVVAVGNPDLPRFGLTSDMLGQQLHDDDPETRRSVMYIDTGLIAHGHVFQDEAAFIAHLVETKAALGAQGYTLLVKLHPALRQLGTAKRLIDCGVDVIDDQDFLARLQQCCASIVEPTTLALVPALLGMPLFLACYDRTGELRFGEVLRSYPRARELADLQQFGALLQSAVASPDAEVVEWIDTNAGPLPAEAMPARVAGIVLSLTGHATAESPQYT